LSAIETRDLCKYYGDIKAVDGVNFNVQKGEIFGFLGPNGAGKTTTIKLLTTLVHPTKGSARVLGYDILSESLEIRKGIGVVQQEHSFEPTLSVEDQLDLYGYLWGLPKAQRNERVEFLLNLFDLKGVRKTKTPELSVGTRRRVQIAREFMHNMDLLFLDEPTEGLDPLSKRTIWNFVKDFAKKGVTIFLTTHIMEEAEALCDKIAIINKGKIVAFDTPDGLRTKVKIPKLIDIVMASTENAESFIEKLQRSNLVEKVEYQAADSKITISSKKPLEILPLINDISREMNIKITSLSIKEPSLEDIFVEIVTRGYEDG
jgi:ABC-2 type transport system ATP-binding protein